MPATIPRTLDCYRTRWTASPGIRGLTTLCRVGIAGHASNDAPPRVTRSDRSFDRPGRRPPRDRSQAPSGSSEPRHTSPTTITEDSMPETTLTPKSVRIAEDEATWLAAAAAKGAVTQNDLLRLALNRLRKDLGAASRIKPETVLATAKASKYKLTPPRVPAAKAPAAAKRSPGAVTNGS